MEKFLYVFDKDSRDILAQLGFKLLRNDENGNVFVFANRADMSFELSDMTFVRSDTLIF